MKKTYMQPAMHYAGKAGHNIIMTSSAKKETKKIVNEPDDYEDMWTTE